MASYRRIKFAETANYENCKKLASAGEEKWRKQGVMSTWDELKRIFGIKPVNIEKLKQAALQQPTVSRLPPEKHEEIEVTEDYKEILSWLKAKAPIVFVTGKAGTGKTVFIRYVKDQFEGTSVVVAPTGVAALLVNGSTINSFFRFPPRLITDDDVEVVRDRRLYRKLELLIIDEISMVRVDLIDAMDKFLKLNRESPEPFGGVRLLMVGDLFQLPPVTTRKDVGALIRMGYDSPYFFSAKAFEQCDLAAKELTKVFRQTDMEFIKILDGIRVAESLEDLLPILNQRCISTEDSTPAMITLACKNDVADAINDRELNKLSGPTRTYIGEVTGRFDVESTRLPSPMNLSLKNGAQVMFTKNGTQWVNGTMGKIIEMNDDVIRVEVSDNFNKTIHEVQRVTWETYKYTYDENEDKIIPISSGKYRQYPLMLAWAITIHKSQGKTLEKVRIDLGDGAFAYGQVYVAISRCRSLEDIHLVRPIEENDVTFDPTIKRFYSALRRG